MNNYDKFLGKLYDILIKSEIIDYSTSPKDLKEKTERIENYLEKLVRIQTKALGKERYIEEIKELYHDRYIIKREDVPESYFHSLEKRYLDEGHGHHNLVNPTNEIDRELKEEHINVIIREQKESLDTWLNYFLSPDSDYLPMWAKVWAFQGMLNIGNLNKEKDGYGRRGQTSINPFVQLDHEILGKCVDLIKETFNKKEVTYKEIAKLVSSGSFPKLYGKLLANKKGLKIESDEGIWVKYNYESEEAANEKLANGEIPEYLKLYNSLQGYNTGWCTAGNKGTAKSQICGGNYPGGDFYVYYTKDKNGEYKIPRIAIRMNKDSIGEIRGVAPNQNIENSLENVLEEKLKEFPDGKTYQKKIKDMKMLTQIYDNYQKRDLTKEELAFLYEIDERIEGFGYQRDPRINEIKSGRNTKKDLAKAFDCSEQEIGTIPQDLTRKLKVYYGDIHMIPTFSELPEIVCGNLDLSYLKSPSKEAENLKLPKIVNGNLSLSKLTKVSNLKLPEKVGGFINLNSLESIKEITFPKIVGGDLYLSGLTTAEGLILPQSIGGSIYLDCLKSAKGLKLPEVINGPLYLNSLTSIEGLELPRVVNDMIALDSVSSAKGLKLPENFKGCLRLCSLKSAEGITFPEEMGSLNLDSLNTTKGLVLPKTIRGSLYLNGLESAKGLVLPQTIERILSLRNLKDAEGLKLPEKACRNIQMNKIKMIKGITFPKEVSEIELLNLESAEDTKFPEISCGDIIAPKLITMKNCIFPKKIQDTLSLPKLSSVEKVTFPEIINGEFYAPKLEKLKKVTFPKKMNGDLDIENVIYAEDITFPESDYQINMPCLVSATNIVFPKKYSHNIRLGSLKEAKDIRFPEILNGNLRMHSLKKAQNVTLPKYIDGYMEIIGLTTINGVTLPEHVTGFICYNNLGYTSYKQFIENVPIDEETMLRICDSPFRSNKKRLY